jgi:pantoate--beta-alanine ligase
LVISIFVNPAQFGADEDFDDYPRDPKGDLEKAEAVGVNLVFSPPVEEIYPAGFQTTITVREVTQYLCGLSRPGHFDGVTTVVAKLFNITKPHVALFGQKDYQQLMVIRRMAKDLNMDIRIVGVPTVRETDGLAMSSRNSYLSPEERKSALCLKKSLDLADRMFMQGERRSTVMIQAIEKLIKAHPFTEIVYIRICHPTTLEDVEIMEEEPLVALAVKVGKAKLIDNCLVGRDSG